MDAPALSWGLLIATKDRPEELRVCIERACAQTRPPSEIVVVDASAAWQDHRRAIETIVQGAGGIRFDYLPAELPSLTVQRNQALDRATADVVFLIDDDSFMHPDCAEEIMRVYEADTGREVAGVQASLARPERKVGVRAQAKTSPLKIRAARLANRSKAWRRFIFHGVESVFIPYDGAYHDRPVPEPLRHLAVRPARLFHGARMTYRRENALRERFDPILRAYCPFEDLDASYRISRTGCLLTATEARLHHFETASDRIDHFSVTLLDRLNRAVLLRRHGSDRDALRGAYLGLLRRHVLADLARDLSTMRLTLPKVRATLRARMLAPGIFAMTNDEIEAWYPGMQARILAKGRKR